MVRQFNNVLPDFRKVGNPQFSRTPVGGVRRFFTPAIVRGIPGQRIASAPNTTGADAYSLQSPKVQKIKLDNTFTDQLFNLSGTVLWYITSTNTTDSLLIRIGDITADQLQWGPGNGFEGIPYNKVFISNTVGVANAVAQLVYFSDTPEKPVRFF